MSVLELDQPSQESPSYVCSKGWGDRCSRAKGPRCECNCQGHNHGNPKAVKDKVREHLDCGSVVSPHFKPYLDEALRCNPACRWCGAKLTGPVIGYPRDGGWIVPGFPCPDPYAGPEGRWWLFIVCDSCDYQWALWKLGVARDLQLAGAA